MTLISFSYILEKSVIRYTTALYKMYGQLGYSQDDVDAVIKKVEALGRMMRNQ